MGTGFRGFGFQVADSFMDGSELATATFGYINSYRNCAQGLVLGYRAHGIHECWLFCAGVHLFKNS